MPSKEQAAKCLTICMSVAKHSFELHFASHGAYWNCNASSSCVQCSPPGHHVEGTPCMDFFELPSMYSESAASALLEDASSFFDRRLISSSPQGSAVDFYRQMCCKMQQGYALQSLLPCVCKQRSRAKAYTIKASASKVPHHMREPCNPFVSRSRNMPNSVLANALLAPVQTETRLRAVVLYSFFRQKEHMW